MNFVQVKSAEEIESARKLFEEYAQWLEISLCFQDFEGELASLPGNYQPPSGRLLLAFVDQKLAGCVALRQLGESICEMKRLYLKPEFRGKGLGRVLAEKIIHEARKIGYQRMRLDTLPGKMDRAIELYRLLGFNEIPAYCNNPVPGATFMELIL
ncbi:MAG TPA: GNAT family N-acetyltransferase [Pyrinomonadaceae bacterium]|nr:GNAT family N-acetyltransferase [Pyrinomonadaceae bacterium]